MIRPGAALLIVGIAACGGAPFSSIGSLDAGDAGELVDAGGLDEVLVDGGRLDVQQGDAAADVVDEQLDEVLVDVRLDVQQGDAAADVVAADAGCLHSDGMGQSFTACEGPPGSYDRTLAEDACAAYAAATPGAACVAAQLGCQGSGFGVCAEGSSSCTCWEYAGPGAGHVHTASACACATSSDPSWE